MESGWCVRRNIGQGAKAVVAGVQSTVHVLGCQPGGHGMDVGGGLCGSDGHCPRRGDGVGGGVTHGDALRNDLCVQLIEPSVSVQTKRRSMSQVVNWQNELVARAEIALCAARTAQLPY
eukprot:1993665-Pleurochrysis_carterae.AAC.3